MEIIIGRENAEKLRSKYTVLDLETIESDGKAVDVFCLIPAEKIRFEDLPKLPAWIDDHNKFLMSYFNEDYETCSAMVGELQGRFGGEVDSFYQEILKRINNL